MTIAIDQPTLLDNIIYYGLLVGAVFQMICIMAVVYFPQSENEEEGQEEPTSDSKSVQSPTGGAAKKGKKEKKKHK